MDIGFGLILDILLLVFQLICIAFVASIIFSLASTYIGLTLFCWALGASSWFISKGY